MCIRDSSKIVEECMLDMNGVCTIPGMRFAHSVVGILCSDFQHALWNATTPYDARKPDGHIGDWTREDALMHCKQHIVPNMLAIVRDCFAKKVDVCFTNTMETTVYTIPANRFSLSLSQRNVGENGNRRIPFGPEFFAGQKKRTSGIGVLNMQVKSLRIPVDSVTVGTSVDFCLATDCCNSLVRGGHYLTSDLVVRVYSPQRFTWTQIIVSSDKRIPHIVKVCGYNESESNLNAIPGGLHEATVVLPSTYTINPRCPSKTAENKAEYVRMLFGSGEAYLRARAIKLANSISNAMMLVEDEEEENAIPTRMRMRRNASTLGEQKIAAILEDDADIMKSGRKRGSCILNDEVAMQDERNGLRRDVDSEEEEEQEEELLLQY